MKKTAACFGAGVLCLGVGILFASFLPAGVLIILQAVLLIAAGLLALKCP